MKRAPQIYVSLGDSQFQSEEQKTECGRYLQLLRYTFPELDFMQCGFVNGEMNTSLAYDAMIIVHLFPNHRMLKIDTTKARCVNGLNGQTKSVPTLLILTGCKENKLCIHEFILVKDDALFECEVFNSAYESLERVSKFLMQYDFIQVYAEKKEKRSRVGNQSTENSVV